MLQAYLRREIHHIMTAVAEASGGVDVLGQHQQVAAAVPVRPHLHGLEVGVHTGVAGHGHIQVHRRQAVALPRLKRLHRGVGLVIGILQVEEILAEEYPLQFVNANLVAVSGADVAVQVGLHLIAEVKGVDVGVAIFGLVDYDGVDGRVRLERRLQVDAKTAAQQGGEGYWQR